MNILYFAPIYYFDMKQRPQQIAELLSENHRVYYIEPTISAVRQLIKGGERSCKGEQIFINPNLTVIRLNGLLTFHKSVEILDFLGINNLSEFLQIRKLVQKCDVLWVGYSGWYTLVRHIKNKPVVFDKMDEEDMLVPSKLLKKTLQRNKKKMVGLANTIIVTCQKFYDELSVTGKPVFLISNAVSDRFMENVLKENDCDEIGQIENVNRIGYIGTIGEWFDMDVVDELLSLNKTCKIVLVGRNYLLMNKNPRVIYLGVRDNSELPEIIKTFDICLYNFKKSELLDTINPVKIYEYLSANKPVLAVRSAETVRLKNYLMLYDDKNDIRKYLAQDIKKPFANENERIEFIKGNSWRVRTQEINSILSRLGEKT